MTGEKRAPVLDWFRLMAAVMVVGIHTAPFADYSPVVDYVLTRVLGRVAVPFFLMLSGRYVLQADAHSWHAFIKRTALVYAGAIVLYLPLNLYAGGIPVTQWLRAIAIDGTFYHLWYFPALLCGMALSRLLLRTGRRTALCAAAFLYLIGLFGDSYFGFTAAMPVLSKMYTCIFSVCAYTRNGLFYAPVFLLLGTVRLRLRRGALIAGACACTALLIAEGLWLYGRCVQRHDSMYLVLPFCMLFLFALLSDKNHGRSAWARDVAQWVYLLHPWCIVLVRGAAKQTGLTAILIENHLVHFFAVLLASFAAAALAVWFWPVGRQKQVRAWKTIDLGVILHNAHVLQTALGPQCRLMAVVKADAYGHGAVRVARMLQRRAGVHAFAVACLQEAETLRRHGVRGTILVLGYTPPQQAARLRRFRITQSIVDVDYARALDKQGVRVRVHLALDTGMHRIGVPAADKDAIDRIYAMRNLRICGVYSHLCCSDDMAAQQVTQAQLTAFADAVARMRREGLAPGATHIQASYGIWNLPPQSYDYARPGIALYGVRSDDKAVLHPLFLRPALSLQATVASVRVVPAGDGAGYAHAFHAARDTRVATITIGYADGLPQVLCQKGGQVLLGGRRCPMIGRMCMDQLLVDVTQAPSVVPGDVATLIGTQCGTSIDALEVAMRCGISTNELLSRLGARLETIYMTSPCRKR